jgi:hypothetical protein
MSTLTQTQVTGGAYDVTNASCVVHASGNWNTVTPPDAAAIQAAAAAALTAFPVQKSGVAVTAPTNMATETTAAAAKTSADAAARPGAAMTLADGAIKDASFTVPSLTAPATGPVGYITQLWRRFFGKATMTATQIKTYDDAGTTPVTTQTVSDDLTTQTQGKAS